MGKDRAWRSRWLLREHTRWVAATRSSLPAGRTDAAPGSGPLLRTGPPGRWPCLHLSYAPATHRRLRGIPHNGVMLMGNKKAQRITVGVIIGVIVVSLALSLISTASATP